MPLSCYVRASSHASDFVISFEDENDHIPALCDDVMYLIFAFSISQQTSHIGTLRSVCRNWKENIDSDPFIRKFIVEKFHLTDDKTLSLCHLLAEGILLRKWQSGDYQEIFSPFEVQGIIGATYAQEGEGFQNIHRTLSLVGLKKSGAPYRASHYINSPQEMVFWDPCALRATHSLDYSFVVEPVDCDAEEITFKPPPLSAEHFGYRGFTQELETMEGCCFFKLNHTTSFVAKNKHIIVTRNGHSGYYKIRLLNEHGGETITRITGENISKALDMLFYKIQGFAFEIFQAFVNFKRYF